MATFHKGDTVRYFSKSAQREVLATITGVATNGIVWLTWNDYPSGDEKKVLPEKLTLISTAPQPEKKPIASFRYVCLECGKKYNGRSCPLCGSDERILNTDSDLDMSILLGGSSAEPYAPGEE